MPHDTLGPLEDIDEAAQFIVDDTAGITFDAFLQERRTRQAVEQNFEIIGEAVSRLRRRAPDITEQIGADRQIVGLRNALIHGYDAIDYAKLWLVIKESLPVLRAEVALLLREAEGEENASGP